MIRRRIVIVRSDFPFDPIEFPVKDRRSHSENGRRCCHHREPLVSSIRNDAIVCVHHVDLSETWKDPDLSGWHRDRRNGVRREGRCRAVRPSGRVEVGFVHHFVCVCFFF